MVSRHLGSVAESQDKMGTLAGTRHLLMKATNLQLTTRGPCLCACVASGRHGGREAGAGALQWRERRVPDADQQVGLRLGDAQRADLPARHQHCRRGQRVGGRPPFARSVPDQALL